MAKQKETVIEVGEFKGFPVLKIYELRDDGQKRDAPTLSFGTSKAKLIVKHIEDVEAFAEDNLDLGKVT